MRLNMMDCVSRLSVVLTTVILPVTRWVFFLSTEIGTKLTTGCVRPYAIRRSIIIPSIRSCTASSRQTNGLLIRVQLHVWHVGSGTRISKSMKDKRGRGAGGGDDGRGELFTSYIAFVDMHHCIEIAFLTNDPQGDNKVASSSYAQRRFPPNSRLMALFRSPTRPVPL